MGHQTIMWTRHGAGHADRFNFYLTDGTFGLDYVSPTGVRHPVMDTHTRALVPINAWTHVAVTRAGNTYAVYANGSFAESATDENPDLPKGTGWHLGGRERFEFRGSIDELSLYNRALTADEIQAIYVAGQAAKPSRTVATER
jgi:hypothetical protein